MAARTISDRKTAPEEAMSIYKRGETWWLYIVHNKRKIRRSTWTTNEREAQRIHDEFKAELWQSRPDAHSWREAVTLWLEAGQRDMSDRYRIRALSIEPSTYIDTLTPDSLAKVLSGQSPASHNRTANLITAILNMAVRREWLPKAPKIERKKLPPATIRWLTPDEWERLQPFLTPHQLQMARMALATGLRQHNITHMRWDHIDLTRRITWVDTDQAKAMKAISVPLSDNAVEVLREQLGQNQEWVFTYRGKPVSEVKTAWRTAVERSGIKWVRWHDLRHTWATWHIQAGTPVEVLQELGGWADLEMVMKYAHLHPSHLASYANNSKPGELKKRSDGHV